MNIKGKIKRALRGEVGIMEVALEAGRRIRLAVGQYHERKRLAKRRRSGIGEPNAVLMPRFAAMTEAALLEHFRHRHSPKLLPGLETTPDEARVLFPERSLLLSYAEEILSHQWPLLGFGTFDFGAEIDWLRDPLSGARWSRDYHGDVQLMRGDGSDVRVLWEANRLGHLLTLTQAYAFSSDERFAAEFFSQIDSWCEQNPAGYGPNWTCAMEVALRAMNLLVAFCLVRRSPALNERRLLTMVRLFETHGRYIREHLEFSYTATGNHYLADVTGLFWLGLYLPELRDAEAWRAFGCRELLREMDKQILADGADCEASTGYHRFVTELFLYSFVLCRANGIEIDEKYWLRLRLMLEYMRAYLRPDGRAPLLGDADGASALSLARRAADDHAYLLGCGAALFGEPQFKTETDAPAELIWLLGTDRVQVYNDLPTAGAPAVRSAIFADAGTCVLRDRDLYLLFSAKGAGLHGRGAHGHNDALSIEVSACGVSFLSDPGSYVYTADLHERHAFRSTQYHSTVEVDGAEQNEIVVDSPFTMGDQASPRIVRWESDDHRDLAIAEHRGYGALPAGPIRHRRAITFDKSERYWLIEDTLSGSGMHDFRFIFHAAPGRESRLLDENAAEIRDDLSGAQLVVASFDSLPRLTLESRWSSRSYGAKTETVAACWKLRAEAPLVTRWLLLPIYSSDDSDRRFELLDRLKAMKPRA